MAVESDQNLLPEIDPSLCLGRPCQKCILACPFNVLHIEENKLVVGQPENCNACGQCVNDCPVDAIWLS